MSKTNVEYLRQCIKGNEKANEFLDAVVKEISEKNKKIESLKDDCNCGCEELEYANVIKTPSGDIRWEADNLQLIAIMESLEEKLKTTIPVEIARILDFNAVSDHKY